MSSIIDVRKKWLAAIPWTAVVQINHSLCHKPGTPPRHADGYAATQAIWDQAVQQELSLRETLDICRRCHALAPFAFFNGNTFAGVVKLLLDDLSKPLNSMEAQMLRSTVAHYVAGVNRWSELRDLLLYLSPKLQPQT